MSNLKWHLPTADGAAISDRIIPVRRGDIRIRGGLTGIFVSRFGGSGRHNVSLVELDDSELLTKFPDIDNGHVYPKHCTPAQRIAIIIPYRDRETHLHLWLNNMIPLFQRQQADVTIFVSEQAVGEDFNRGMMKNIGFNEATKYRDFDCVVMNDVDFVPQDDRNLYQCLHNPIHMSAKTDRRGYSLSYGKLIGGIAAFQTSVFREINGYSNKFFVWGGEDDNLSRRIKEYGYRVYRPFLNISHTTTLRHKRDPRLPLRMEILRNTNADVSLKNDGLNSLKYNLLSFDNKKLYIRILANISRDGVSDEGSTN
ncbi:hypothetical protein ScPMuIL_000251 [Solemya velum]